MSYYSIKKIIFREDMNVFFGSDGLVLGGCGLGAITFLGLWLKEKRHAKTLELVGTKNQLLLQEWKTKALLYEAQLVQQKEHLTLAQQELAKTFSHVSQDVLARNNQVFMDLARTTFEKFHHQNKSLYEEKEKAVSHLVQPLQESMKHIDEKLGALEKERLMSLASMKQHMHDLLLSQRALQKETATLSQSLRAPHVRGRWGEMQLRRVVEMSGLSRHCDFVEQASLETAEGKLRPDVIIKMPGGKQLIVDAKTPLHAYLNAMEAVDEVQRKQFQAEHARHVRQHLFQLGRKQYWSQTGTDHTPEFVIMFLPGDVFLSAALEADPTLLEYGIEQRVLLTTPATLVALLHAVAYGWQQEALSKQSQEIIRLSQETFKRLCDMTKHLTKHGGDLSDAVNSYNRLVGSLERRVMPSLRKFQGLQSSTTHQLEELEEVALQTRLIGNFVNDDAAGDGQEEKALLKS
jgi:DNA recombination protein RmuC